MNIIYISHPHNYKREDFPAMVLALGYFDGVHLGHQKVIQTAIQIGKEKGLAVGAMTFDPHPSVVLNKNVRHMRLLTPLTEKAELMEQLGLDYLFVIRFSPEFANLTPQQFVDQYLIQLHTIHVVAGFDYTYGQLGKGTMETLPFHARGLLDQTTVSKLELSQEKISSTRIRQELLNGHTLEVESLLGRLYRVKGQVVNGEKRGRLLGFPTANVDVELDYYLPAVGVYCVRMLVKGHWYNGICNVGYKPTFHNSKDEIPTVEVHLLDFKDDIYTENVVIEWHGRIRDEKKFKSLEALVAQLEADKQFAMDYFKTR